MAAKKGRQATRGGNGGKPAWLWILVGMLAGVGLMLLVLGKDWAPLLRKKGLPQPNPQATAPKEGEPPVAEAKPKKNYDFYQVLPEAEVVRRAREAAARDGRAPEELLSDVLSTVMLFLLFVAGEHLEPGVHQALHSRVKSIVSRG